MFTALFFSIFSLFSLQEYKNTLIQCQKSLNQNSGMISCKEASKENAPAKQASDNSYVAYFINNTYTNLKYNFQITIPEGWSVGEYDSGSDPRFIFYKNLPYDTLDKRFPQGLMDNGTYIAIYPQGRGTEGIPGKTAPSIIQFNSETQTAIDYVLENGSHWATLVYDFKDMPELWDESGFIIGTNLISEKQEACEQDGKLVDISQCHLNYGDPIIYLGTIDKIDRQNIEATISSFKFIP